MKAPTASQTLQQCRNARMPTQEVCTHERLLLPLVGGGRVICKAQGSRAAGLRGSAGPCECSLCHEIKKKDLQIASTPFSDSKTKIASPCFTLHRRRRATNACSTMHCTPFYRRLLLHGSFSVNIFKHFFLSFPGLSLEGWLS